MTRMVWHPDGRDSRSIVKCPRCASTETRVTKTRLIVDEHDIVTAVWRRRQCADCASIFRTETPTERVTGLDDAPKFALPAPKGTPASL